MRAVDVIAKKKLGGKLSEKEIKFIVGGYVDGSVPDYQFAAFLMAVYLQGMDVPETVALTKIMRDSGDQVPLTGIKGIKVDKHSTGGVGDKTTLTLAPLLASCGLVVAKMSGRGLGHTGGTLDKLESIKGFDINLNAKQFKTTVNKHGIAVVGQTARIVPADKKIYALRDVTATVGNVSLIASSIMSKKLAVNNDALVLDVKVGSGAFMKSLKDARELARLMVKIGKSVGRKVRAVITDMNQPLGEAVGNAMEVQEAIDTLQGKGPADFTEVVYSLASQLLTMTGKARGDKAARALCDKKIKSGEAYEKFRQFIAAQKGSLASVDKLPKAKKKAVYKATKTGYITAIDTEGIGVAAMKLGAGRATKEDVIDHAVGFQVKAKIGDRVKKGQPLVVIHYNHKKRLDAARAELANAFTIKGKKPGTMKIVYDVIK